MFRNTNLLLALVALMIIPSFSMDELNKEMIQLHNDFRRHYRSGRLRYSESLANEAKKWAIHLAESGRMYSSPENSFGENISWI